jgi:hypothetical protein
MAILGINEFLTLLGYFLSAETSVSVSIFNAGILRTSRFFLLQNYSTGL